MFFVKITKRENENNNTKTKGQDKHKKRSLSKRKGIWKRDERREQKKGEMVEKRSIYSNPSSMLCINIMNFFLTEEIEAY